MQKPISTTVDKNEKHKNSQNVVIGDSEVTGTTLLVDSPNVAPLESGKFNFCVPIQDKTNVDSVHYGTRVLKNAPPDTVVVNNTMDVSIPVESVYISTPVLEDGTKNTSTGTDSTVSSKKRKFDSIEKNYSNVKDTVENYFDVDEEYEMYSDNCSEDSE